MQFFLSCFDNNGPTGIRIVAGLFRFDHCALDRSSLFEQLQDLFKGFVRKGCRIFVIDANQQLKTSSDS